MELSSECNKSNARALPSSLLQNIKQLWYHLSATVPTRMKQAQTMFRCYMLDASMFNVKCKEVAECAA